VDAGGISEAEPAAFTVVNSLADPAIAVAEDPGLTDTRLLAKFRSNPPRSPFDRSTVNAATSILLQQIIR
jgi:hypothetical protein